MPSLDIFLPNPFYSDVDGVPVTIEIRDVTLDHVDTRYVPLGSSDSVTVDPGIYVVEAQLPSGQSMQQVVDVSDGGDANLQMDMGKLSPHEFHAWAYLNKNAKHRPSRSLEDAEFEGAWARLWRRDDNSAWEIFGGELTDESRWNDDGINYRLNAFGGMQMLQVGGPNVPWKCVALPGAQELKILIRPANGPESEVHPLDITVSTRNTGAEAILSKLTSGDVDSAAALENAGAAEMMLYGKMQDPTAAAIGGYYLLKIGELNRLHNWSQNLANWIDWMADGPVIRAWHLLKAVRYEGLDPDEAQQKARSFLLEAVDRGVPIYTEGLRLLRDGINVLSANPEDIEAREAKAIVDGYAQSCDWTAPLTTFLGERPDTPSPEPMTGLPERDAEFVFLYNVNAEELLRQGVVSAGTTLTLDRWEDTPLEVTVEDDGEFNLDGTRFKRLQDIAKSYGLEESEMYGWKSSESGEYLAEGVDNLRHGRFKVFEEM